MNSFATGNFWRHFNSLPEDIKELAKHKFDLWKENPFHGKLNFKCINKEFDLWSVRINLQYRAIGQRNGDSIIWDWIGTHNDYDILINK